MQVLSEETQLTGAGLGEGWQLLAHVDPARLALIVRAGEEVSLPPVQVEPGQQLYLEYGAGLDPISPDGLDCVVEFRPPDGDRRVVFSEHLPAFRPESPWIRRDVPLDDLAGQHGAFAVLCGPGPRHDPIADWLALTRLIVCHPSQRSLALARMHPERRRRNEDEHFSAVYRMPFFSEDKPNPWVISNGLIVPQVVGQPIDFGARLRGLCEERPVRLLSLCAGAARIEEQLLQGVEDRVELTLMDINPDLLDLAAARLGRLRRVDKLAADANSVSLPRRSFDVVLCVSALHHVVELEHLLDQVAGSLASGGELWSMGEYVGRSGSRLWPESYEVANRLFRELPARLRVNHVAYSPPAIDEDLPNRDCSLVNYEGVRAGEIEGLLDGRFEEVDADRWDTISWRLLDPAYGGNYDVDDPEDRKWIELIARTDIECTKSGRLRPVTLQGVFRSRR